MQARMMRADWLLARFVAYVLVHPQARARARAAGALGLKISRSDGLHRPGFGQTLKQLQTHGVAQVAPAQNDRKDWYYAASNYLNQERWPFQRLWYVLARL